MKQRRIDGRIISSIGILFLFAGLVLLAYNIWDSERANRVSEQLTEQLFEYREENEGDWNSENDPNRPMPEATINGVTYIGNLQVPSLGLDLPIATAWSYDLLKIAPCRYTGSVYLNNMVLAAHNYRRHFGQLRSAELGTEVRFVDMDGNKFRYTIVANEVMEPTAVEKMVVNDYDLTLFTCVNSGQARYAIRCNLIEEA